jgi:hypothetical protein
MKIEQLKFPGKILHQRRAALHPVTAVQILNPLDTANLRPMNMTTDHSMRPVLARQFYHAFLKPGHISNRRLGILLQVRRDRPIAKAKSAPDPVEVSVEDQDRLIQSSAHTLEESIELNEPIQLMAMNHQIPAAVSRNVKGMGNNLDPTHIETREILEELIVIPVYVNDPGVFAILAENFLNDRVGIRTPVPPSS